MRIAQIAAMEKQIKDLRCEIIEKIKTIQKECKHERIIDGGERRICAQCGYEEFYQYSWGSARTSNGGSYEFICPPGQQSKLYSEQFVKKDSVIRYRINL